MIYDLFSHLRFLVDECIYKRNDAPDFFWIFFNVSLLIDWAHYDCSLEYTWKEILVFLYSAV